MIEFYNFRFQKKALTKKEGGGEKGKIKKRYRRPILKYCVDGA